jgi:hypothetical protein
MQPVVLVFIGETQTFPPAYQGLFSFVNDCAGEVVAHYPHIYKNLFYRFQSCFYS